MSTTNILFSGVGGQGIILASRLVAKCAFNAGIMVKESELHGMAQRGGSVVSHVRYGDEVNSPLIPAGHADVLVAMEELEGLRYTHFLKEGGKVILNLRKIPPPNINPSTPYPDDAPARLASMGFGVVTLDAMAIAKDCGTPKAENIVLVGALSNYLAFDTPLWEETIKESVPAKFLDANLTAFHKGRETTAFK
ncbi:MAG: indolepyruvate oxidoreductase subunit beta [Nitrospirae bacterium]|nr:indolepyruvate oxidoreductase subunit beta [Nitrospirota bacterium]